MKAVIASLVLGLAALCSPAAKAWDCPTGQIRQQAPAGTPTTTPYYDVVEGIAFICVPATPPTTPTGGSNAVSGSQSNSSSSSSSNANSQAGASSNSNATGGASQSNSSATGGNATATGGKSVATGGAVSNSGNSTVSVSPVITSTANGGAGGSANQKQTQSVNNSGNSSASASNNGDGSNNSSFVTNIPRDTATAYAPAIYPTATCFKGFSGGAQGPAFGLSFGGGKIDQNCAILESAVKARNIRTFCMIYITDKFVKAAGVTLEDCIGQQTPPAPVVIRESAPIPPPAIIVNVPAPVVTIIPQPVAPAPPSLAVIAKKVQAAKVPHSNKKCYTDEELSKLKQ